MDFTYNSFKNLINTLLKNNFIFCDYTNYLKFYKSVIMRHDIDFSLEKALEIAKIESNMGVKSTFFLLITSNFYNVFSLEAEKIIREIISLNHKIGLHFDETRYDNNDFNLLIHKEIKLTG